MLILDSNIEAVVHTEVYPRGTEREPSLALAAQALELHELVVLGMHILAGPG